MSVAVRVSSHEIVVLVLLLAVACTRRDPLYCDESTPCTDPARPFCDLVGEYPASDGVGRTCIENPLPPLPADAGADAMPSVDAQVQCEESIECPATAPICDGMSCQACELGQGGDAACAARDADAPHCDDDGQCKACTSNLHCVANPEEPICDDGTGTCRGCQDHADCASGACNLVDGSCILSTDIIYADAALGDDTLGCGDAPGIAACRSLDGNNGALDKVAGMRRTVVAAGTFAEDVSIVDTDVVLIGYSARIRPPAFMLTHALRVIGGSSVEVYGFELREGNGLSAGVGVICQSSQVLLQDVSVLDNDAPGIGASDCQLTVRDSVVSGNGRQGLALTDTELLAQRVTVADNAFQGLDIEGGSVEITESVIAGNQAGGIRISDAAFLIENDFIVHNGNLAANPVGPAGGIVIRNFETVARQIIRHCTIAENQGPVVIGSAGVDCGNADEAIECPSNIVFGNSTPTSDAEFDGDCVFSYSNVEGIGSGTGNISIEPIFIDTPARNFHLHMNSPGIDLGDPSSPTLIDIDGEARPSGSAADMGADEV